MKKLYVTLHFRNITQEDDSTFGKLEYECHAFAAGEPGARQRYGFSVNVIASKFSWLRPNHSPLPENALPVMAYRVDSSARKGYLFYASGILMGIYGIHELKHTKG